MHFLFDAKLEQNVPYIIRFWNSIFTTMSLIMMRSARMYRFTNDQFEHGEYLTNILLTEG